MRKPYYPFEVQIELVQGCNRNCSFCGTAGMEKRFFQMEDTTALHISELLSKFGFTGRILLAGHGEPTLHNNPANIVAILKRKNPKAHITMFTNGFGIFRNEGLIHELFTAGLDAIMFDEYSDNIIGGRVKNIKGIEKYKIERLAAGVPLFDRKKRKRVLIAPPIDVAENGAMNRKLCNHCGAGGPPLENPLKRPCSIIFRDFFIRWDGNVAICCNDFRGEYFVCNIKNCDTFEEAYYHPRLEAARRRLMVKDRGFFPCNICNVIPIREGLLPDKMGKYVMPAPTQKDIEITGRRFPALSAIRKREWE